MATEKQEQYIKRLKIDQTEWVGIHQSKSSSMQAMLLSRKAQSALEDYKDECIEAGQRPKKINYPQLIADIQNFVANLSIPEDTGDASQLIDDLKGLGFLNRFFSTHDILEYLES